MDQRLGHGIGHSSQECAMEICYLRGACGMMKRDGEGNENVYKGNGMRCCANALKCCVVEWVKRSTLWWFGNFERKKRKEFVKKVYMSEIES